MQTRTVAKQKVITSAKLLKQISGGSGGEKFPREKRPKFN